MRIPVLFSTLLFAACGGGKGGASTTVMLDTSGPPDVVAVKLGDGEWQALEVSGSAYEIQVDQPYVVAVSCNDFTDLLDTYMFARTPDDNPELIAPCTGEPLLDGRIQGTFAQIGEVSVGFQTQSTASPNGAFDLEASGGTHELVGITDDAIVIRRNVEISGITQLQTPLDVGEGAPLVPANFIVTNALPDESPLGIVRLFTEHSTSAFTFGDVSTMKLIPDEVLVADDFQGVSVSTSRSDGLGNRSVSFGNARSDLERTVTLPEYISDDVVLDDTGGTISAQWGNLPDHDVLRFQVDQTVGSVFVYADLEISPAYADEMGTQIALDLAIPGLDPANAIDVDASYTRSFGVTKFHEGFSTFSSINETTDQPQPKRRPAIKKRALAYR